MAIQRWTAAHAAMKCRRKLGALERLLEKTAIEIAYEWGDVD